MIINIDKKEVVTKVNFIINFENEDEVQAFKNILQYAESDLYSRIRDNRYKKEIEILDRLKKLL